MEKIDIVRSEAYKRFCHVEKLINSCNSPKQMNQLPWYADQLVRQLEFIILQHSTGLGFFTYRRYMKNSKNVIHIFLRSFWEVYTERVTNLN